MGFTDPDYQRALAAQRKKAASTVTASTKAKAQSAMPDYARTGYQGRTYTRPDGSQGNYALEAQEYTKYYSPSAQRALTQQPQAPSSGGSGRSGGGYGGGGGYAGIDPKAQAATQQWLDSMLKQIASGYFKAPAAQQNQLQGMIDPAIQKDLASADGAYNALDAYLNQARPNPYAQMQVVQAPAITPELAAYIKSQGGDLGAYGHQVEGANAGMQAMGANWQNFANAQAANVDQSVAADKSLSQLGRTQARTGIEGARTGLEAAATQMQMKLEEAQRARQAQLDQERMQLVLQMLTAARDAQVAMPTIPGA